ncbi:MAG: chloride channel protein [Lachnospiraceae bacterium]|nr:chloride channel protein [Lachnospiraceae bacterium]
MNNVKLRHTAKHNMYRLKDTVKWIVIAVFIGIILGVTGALFSKSIAFVTELRQTYPKLLFLLPFVAMLILFIYKYIGKSASGGTNLVLLAIQKDKDIPLRMAPLIFISTVISHMAGASVGREGAALQLGGSIGGFIGKGLRLNDTDKKTLIMTGMSAAFSALLGTPIAASIFSIEVVSVGIMHYSALLPCVIASYIARYTASLMGIGALKHRLSFPESVSIPGMAIVLALAICCGLISILFCAVLHNGENKLSQLIKNEYLKAFLLGSIVLILSLIDGGQTFNGAGNEYIVSCIDGNERSVGFLIKILFTALSIIAGYKGGEIIPSFFIGASLGSFFGNLIGYDPTLCASLGIAGVFCGVTNCPITSLLIYCEIFGFDAAPYALLTCAISYIISGYYGLYTDQKIVYSKFRSNFIDKKTL